MSCVLIYYFVLLQSSDPVINTDNDDTLMLKLNESLTEGGVGMFSFINCFRIKNTVLK